MVEHIKLAMKETHYHWFKEEDSFYGEIPGFQGVYANEITFEKNVVMNWNLF